MRYVVIFEQLLNNPLNMTNKKAPRLRPGFVRVMVEKTGKTTRIRSQHANNQKYMIRHGLIPLPEPVIPQMAGKPAEPQPAPINLTVEAPKKSKISKRMPDTPVVQADNTEE